MPLLTSVAFGWPCHAQRAKPVLEWLMANAKTGTERVTAGVRPALFGEPAVMAATEATLERLFQPDTGKLWPDRQGYRLPARASAASFTLQVIETLIEHVISMS